MEVPKIYLETTMFSFYYEERTAPLYLEHKALVAEYGVVILPITEEIEQLAALYVQEKAISPAWATDAAHIATATYNGLDFIVSLNFTHIVRPWTIEKVRMVNMREKYQAIGIYKPAEVLEIYEDGTGVHE
jgi:hypothetical protein